MFCPPFKSLRGCFVHLVKTIGGTLSKWWEEFCPPIQKWAGGVLSGGVLSYTRLLRQHVSGCMCRNLTLTALVTVYVGQMVQFTHVLMPHGWYVFLPINIVIYIQSNLVNPDIKVRERIFHALFFSVSLVLKSNGPYT